MRWVFRRKLRMNDANVARSRATIDAGLTWLESRIKTPTQHLVGDRLTVADLTAAALLAPLACPDEHPVYGSARYRAGVAPLVGEWQERPAFAWVRAMYRNHRGNWPRSREIRKSLEGT